MTQASPASAKTASATDIEDEGLELDTKFHLLQNERRRLALRYLVNCDPGTDEAIEMRDVAEQVAAWEHDTTVRQLDSDQRQRVYVGLYQSHLPKLDQHGVIDYNQSRGRVVPNALCGELEPYLEAAPDEADTDIQRPPPRESREGDGAATADGGTQLLVAVAGIIPFAVLASQTIDSVLVSTTLLAMIVAASALLSEGLRGRVGSALGN